MQQEDHSAPENVGEQEEEIPSERNQDAGAQVPQNQYQIAIRHGGRLRRARRRPEPSSSLRSASDSSSSRAGMRRRRTRIRPETRRRRGS